MIEGKLGLGSKRTTEQSGVALFIALLMVATLSFIAIGVTETMTLSAKRTGASNSRAQIFWRAVSAEVVVRTALERVLGEQDSQSPLTLTHPLFLGPIDIPLPDGTATIQFFDGTRCFNLNSLTPSNSPSDESGPVRELKLLMETLGAPSSTADKTAAVIIDWIDDDPIPTISGAEDNFYSALPSPYRTGGGALASVSEIRAMDGIGIALYRQLSEYLCVAADRKPMKINVNMLLPAHAPLLVALTNGAITISQAQEVLADRPPEGWTTTEAFWSNPVLAETPLSDEEKSARTAINSSYIEARATVEFDGISIEQRLTYQISGGNNALRLLSRQLGEGI